MQINQWQDSQGSKHQSANIIVDFVRWLTKQKQCNETPDIVKQNLDEIHQMLEVADVEGND